MTVGCGDSETETESETETTSNSAEEIIAEPEVSQELKSALEDYEIVADKYVSACEDYFSAVEAGKKASKLKSAYESAREEFNTTNTNVDELNNGLSDVDATYYDEVTTRITEKVAGVLEKHADAVQMIVEQNAQ